MRVLVFGDSITYGEYDTQGGWVERLKTAYFDERLGRRIGMPPTVYNLGIEGEYTKHLAMRLPHEAVARRDLWNGGVEQAFVIAVGTNDSTMTDAGAYFSSPQQFDTDLHELYDIARLFAKRLLFVGLVPVEDDDPRARQYYSTERIWEFEQVLRNFVHEKALPFVPLFEVIQHGMKEEVLFSDGLHPNDEGHRTIYDHVAPEFKKLLAGQ